MAGRRAGGRPPAGRRGRDRILRPGAGGGPVPPAAARRGVAPAAPGLDGVGYREVVAVLAGRLAQRELRDAIVTATRQYAKRQETWFRNQLRHPSSVIRRPDDVWAIDATRDPQALAREIHERWTACRAATDDGRRMTENA